MLDKTVRIAGASGFWGDSARSTSQLLKDESVDFIVYDYLAEVTMSIMARARARNPDAGYALDFVSSAMEPNLKEISRQGIRIVSNAGGVNPQACANALRGVIADLGLNLKVACVLGDDLMLRRDQLAASGFKEMFSGEDFPPLDKIASINAYLGAFPVATALGAGADIVITGRCVDSAVTLGIGIHKFGWTRQDLDELAMGSLAGHILECGPQATGGNFTDWWLSNDLENIGYPIVDIRSSGRFVCSKPRDTGGLVSIGTVAEQMVYEIGDPQAYILPDVICDFSKVTLTEAGDNEVEVRGATGISAPDSYKICCTYADEFRGGTTMTFYGFDADKKARKMSDAIFAASRRALSSVGLPDFTETSVELIGVESQFGTNASLKQCRELSMKLAVKHSDPAGIGILLKECVGLGLATPPGLSGFQGGRPKPSPIVRLFSFVLPKGDLAIQVELDGKIIDCPDDSGVKFNSDQVSRPSVPEVPKGSDLVEVPLIKLAWARSGDKGNKANVGVIARKQEYLPYIFAALDEQAVTDRFAHFLPKGASSRSACYVERFLMPGSNAINYLIHDVLGGGGMASIRNDAQGKGFGQLMLGAWIPVSRDIAETINDQK